MAIKQVSRGFTGYSGRRYDSKTDAAISLFSAKADVVDLWELCGRSVLVKCALWHLVQQNRALRHVEKSS